MATTPVQIFTVDTTTGNVAINGNLFVRSANNNSSWIVGDMIKANTLITLCNGNIVFNGSNGSVTVKDPDAPNSGTYTYINNGYLNQYLNGNLIRSLTGIESGQCKNNTECTLTGTYSAQPSIIISPKSIQSYSAAYLKQSQTFNCNISSISSAGTNKYKFKPLVTISVAAGTDNVSTPAQYNYADHYTEISDQQPDVMYGDINPGLANNKTCIMTTDSVRTSVNCNKIVVNASTYGIAMMPEKGWYINFGYYVTKASHKWRVKYKKISDSTWSYSGYSTETTNVTVAQNVTSSITVNLPSAGNYDVAAEFVLKRTGTDSIGFSSTSYPGRFYASYSASTYTSFESAHIKINSIQCSRPAATVTPTGTLNYIAVGR